MFCSANFPRLPRNLNNFRSSRVEERMNFKKQNIPKKLNCLKSFMNLLSFDGEVHTFSPAKQVVVAFER